MTDEPQGAVLVLEDDEATRTFLSDNLSADGYEPLPAADGRDALRVLETKFPDAAIVDVGLPGPSGLEIVGAVRAADGLTSKLNAALPMIVLSGRADELDRLRAYERGADVFLAKPFSYSELRWQLTALLRRVDQSRRPGRVRVGELELDPSSRTVTVRGHPVEMSQKEYALLRALASDPTRVFTKQELLKTIWGYRAVGTTRTLDSHACRLRTKLAGSGLRYVVNVWGVGYRLIDAVEPSLEVAQEAAAA